MVTTLANAIHLPAGSPHTGAGRLRTLWAYRELMWMLAWRDIRVRYKHSILGAAWAVLPPLAMMVIFTFVFGTATDIDRQTLTHHASLPYPLFAFCGLAPWMFLANGLTSATGSLVANRQLVTKVYFPREVFPLSALISAFIDFVISMGLLGLLIVLFHFRAGGWEFQLHGVLLLAPVVVAVQIVFMAGMALFLSMANLFYRDVNYLFRSLVQLWMFVTCVVYNLDATTGWKRIVIQLNPMTPIIRAYRKCILLAEWPFDGGFCLAAGVSMLMLAVGWTWFRKREFDFAEYV